MGCFSVKGYPYPDYSMKYPILIIAFLCSTVPVFSQRSEFIHYANGLIYDDTTISRLKHFVDSLHIRYKRCDLNKTYYSIPQAKGHFINLDKGNLKTALRDIQSNISLANFIKKYRPATVETNTLITVTKHTRHSVLKLEYRKFDEDFERNASITLQADKADKAVNDEDGTRGRTGKWGMNIARQANICVRS